MKTASAKAKGRRLQQDVMGRILAAFPDLTPDDVTSRSMGAGGADILLSAAAKARFPFAVEAKNQERLNLWSAWQQTVSHAEETHLSPLLVVARNRQTPLAVVHLDALFWLLKGRTP